MNRMRSLVDAVAALRTGETSPDGYAELLRERIESREPKVRAFVDEPNRWGRLSRELSTVASAAGETYGERPPLFGVPVGVKDIFHTRELETRAGTTLPSAELSGGEADVVGRLREAGAAVLGKTVTTAFAYYDPGPTRNPHDLDRTPGGSSSGSAAAVAAGMCPLALGSQTAGSVVRPAAFCGVVGVKPSYGRIPTDGVIPLAPSVDHVGYFTADVPSGRLAASVLCDAWTPADGLEKPVLGVPSESYIEQASDVGQQRFERQCAALEGAGFELRQLPAVLDDIEDINDRHLLLMQAESALVHHEWYETYDDRYGEDIEALILDGRAHDVEALGSARAGRHRLRTEIETRLDERGVDVILSPAAPGPAPVGIDDTGDPVMNVPWTHAGVPAVTVPAGATDDGLPLGLQCVTRFGDDERLLAWAETIADKLPDDAR